MSDSEPNGDERTRPEATGTISPDNETPSWRERKERRAGLAQLTYEYFERSRYEDQELRQESSFVERDVLGFPTWPHEIIRNLALASFFVGMLLLLAATLPPHIGNPANANNTPPIILPDWYLYWSFGLLKTGTLNPELAVIGNEKLMSDRMFGVLTNVIVVGAITIVPFLNSGSARRPVEQPFWAAVGMGGVTFAITISLLSVQNLMPMNVNLLFDLAFLTPFVIGCLTYVVLKTMREGYMYDLNRRYYRLRPPK